LNSCYGRSSPIALKTIEWAVLQQLVFGHQDSRTELSVKRSQLKCPDQAGKFIPTFERIYHIREG